MCYITFNYPSSIWVYTIPTYTISMALLILPLIRTFKESFNMYKVTKKWQPNRYMNILVRDGIVYFFMYVLHFPSP